ncbi:dynamin family protein [Clostridium tyrobutyricum]|uniref:dynamin family protein n=1 Tax=Clostridium tyrobutyricum TaxID=1519 RepID=UPI0011CB1B38|nr:dynamin family protein [Clostridium tyrobutyricum]
MINRTIFLKNLKVAREIAIKYKVNDISKKIEHLIQEIENFKVRVLFVGGFNAGKTALINTFIDEELLKEEQSPETSIAAELVYGEPKRVILCDKEGNKKAILVNEVHNYNSSEYLNYIYCIPNKNLLSISDYIIVDMPGFDSGIEEHNRALLQYVGRGTAYIFVIDCDKGTLSQSALNFINEIKNYNNEITFVITKCDKNIQSNIDKVKDEIDKLAVNFLGQKVKIITTSKFDENAPKKLEEVINSFNGQELFERKYSGKIDDCLKSIILALKIIINSLNFDTNSFENEILEREKVKASLVDKLNFERKKLHSNIQDNVKPTILNDIRNALYSNSLFLATNAISGQENFSRAVNNIIRPILMKKTHQYIENSFSDFVNEFMVDEFVSSEGIESMTEIASFLNEKIKNFTKNINAGNKIYKNITTIFAVTTSFVSSWIELILIFLPDITKVFSNISKSNQIDHFKNEIENEVIPNILVKIEPNIQQSLENIEENMIIELENKINSSIEIQVDALKEIKERKAKKKEEHESLHSNIEKDVMIIKNLIKKQGEN